MVLKECRVFNRLCLLTLFLVTFFTCLILYCLFLAWACVLNDGQAYREYVTMD